jgi:voltage-gated potassium channel
LSNILAIIAVAIVTIDLFTNPSTFTSTLFNYIDLISIIPFNTMFQAFRLIRLIKLLKFTRLMKLTKLVRIAALFGKFKNNVLLKIQERLNNFNELSKEDIDDIYEILKSLKKEQD